MNGIGKGAWIAAAAAGLFGCAGKTPEAAAPAATAGQTVHCQGVNTCKGQGACAGADNACKAQNDCKGKGWVETSEQDCKAQGGTVAPG